MGGTQATVWLLMGHEQGLWLGLQAIDCSLLAAQRAPGRKCLMARRLRWLWPHHCPHTLCSLPMGYRRIRGHPRPLFQSWTRHGPRRHSQSLHLACRLWYPPHCPWPTADIDTPIHAPTPWCLPIPCAAHLLCGRSPIFCLVFAWPARHRHLSLDLCHGLQPHHCGTQTQSLPLLRPISTTRRPRGSSCLFLRGGPRTSPWFAPAAPSRASGWNTLSTRRTPPPYTSWSKNFWSPSALFPSRKRLPSLSILSWQSVCTPEAHTSVFSPRGPSGNVKKSTPFLLRNSAAAPKTFAPLRLKTCTSRSGKVDSASNDFPRWFSNAKETASADYLHMGINGLSSPSKLSVPAGIPAHTTPRCRPWPPSLSDKGTGCPPFSRMDFRATLASLSLSDRKRMLLSLSCLTLSPVVSHPVSTAPKLNTLTFGTATSSLIRMWSPGPGLGGVGNSQIFRCPYLTLSVASLSRLVNRYLCFRDKRGILPTLPSFSQTGSRRSLWSSPTVHPMSSGLTLCTAIGLSLSLRSLSYRADSRPSSLHHSPLSRS